MSRSTIIQPCNDSGYFDPELAAKLCGAVRASRRALAITA